MGTEADFTDAGQRGKPVFCPVSKMRGPHAESARVRRSGDFVLEQARSHEEVQKEIDMKRITKDSANWQKNAPKKIVRIASMANALRYTLNVIAVHSMDGIPEHCQSAINRRKRRNDETGKVVHSRVGCLDGVQGARLHEQRAGEGRMNRKNSTESIILDLRVA